MRHDGAGGPALSGRWPAGGGGWPGPKIGRAGRPRVWRGRAAAAKGCSDAPRAAFPQALFAAPYPFLPRPGKATGRRPESMLGLLHE